MLTAIAVERFIAIVCPLRHHTLLTTRNAGVVTLLCWAYAMLIGSLPLYGWNVVSASSLNSTSSAFNSSPAAAEFTQCRFDTVVGGSYAAFMYPGHLAVFRP